MLAVMLVAGIIVLIESIPLSIRTTYEYSRLMLGITPRGDPTGTQKYLKEIEEKSPVPLERVIICRGATSTVQSIVGKWPFLVIGLEQADLRYYLKKMGGPKLTGRYPEPGKAEAIISRPVAINLGLHLYDPNLPGAERKKGLLQGPELEDSYSPNPVKIVGIAESDKWMMLTNIEYQRANHFPPVDIGMVFARNLADQDKLDHWAVEHFKGRRAQVYAYHQVEEDTQTMFRTLYKILDLVIAVLVMVITLMMAMLINIYQSQRLVEFGLLQAIGYTKRQILKRVLIETVFVVIGGWILGLGAGVLLLEGVRRTLMAPRAFSINIFDPSGFRYTVPIPFAILFVAMLTVVLRFRKFDPVGVVERRLV